MKQMMSLGKVGRCNKVVNFPYKVTGGRAEQKNAGEKGQDE